MELLDAPDAIEISTFHFSQLRTLRLVQGNEKPPVNTVNVVATASKYGLIFIGVENGFKVLKLDNILDLNEDRDNKSIEENYWSLFISSETPILLAINADQKTLAVCVSRNGSVIADLYDIPAFATSVEAATPFLNILLSPNCNKLKDFIWNPAIPETYAFCIGDGSLGIHELSGTTLKILASLNNANATAVSWSPKGKQIVVGKIDGSFSQYKPTLQEVKNIPAPQIGDKLTVGNICWVSTMQFVVLYVPVEKGLPPYLVVVSTPKGAAVTYTNFDDVCLGNSSVEDQRYFLHFEPTWGTMICASVDSIEIAVLGDCPNWVQWDVKEDGKALLPGKDGATHPIGMGVMYSSQRNIVISEIENYPPMPIIFFYTNNGLLVSFHMVNTASGLESLVKPSVELIKDGEIKGTFQNPVTTMPLNQLPTSVSNFNNTQSFVRPFEDKTSNTLFSQPTVGHELKFETQSNNSSSVFNLNNNQNGNNQFTNKSFNENESKPSDSVNHNAVFKVPSTSEMSRIDKSQLSSSSLNVSATVVAANSPQPPDKESLKLKNMTVEDINKQNSYMAAIIEEVQAFEKELQDLKSSSGSFATIGTKEEMAALKSATLNFEDFQKEMAETMSSLNTEIQELKNVLLESFGMVEEANSRERRKNDHVYLSLLKERALDPMTAKRMKKIEQHYLYLNIQLQEVSNKLDQDWFEYLERKKAREKSMHNVSSVEAIYKTLVNNQNIIHNLRKNLDYVSEKINEKKLENISRRNYRNRFIKRSPEEELSKLADTFLQTKITDEEEKSPRPKKMSPEAQAMLKKYLSTAKVITVRPTIINSPSQSRFISKSALFKENLRKVNLTADEDDNKSLKLNNTAGLIASTPKVHSLEQSVMEKSKRDIMKEDSFNTASKFTLPSIKSPSPKNNSSTSISSSGGPYYEDITPPSSPGLLKYPPESLALLQDISQGNFDEEKLISASLLLNTLAKYYNENAKVECNSSTNPARESQYEQSNVSNFEKENKTSMSYANTPFNPMYTAANSKLKTEMPTQFQNISHNLYKEIEVKNQPVKFTSEKPSSLISHTETKTGNTSAFSFANKQATNTVPLIINKDSPSNTINSEIQILEEFSTQVSISSPVSDKTSFFFNQPVEKAKTLDNSKNINDSFISLKSDTSSVATSLTNKSFPQLTSLSLSESNDKTNASISKEILDSSKTAILGSLSTFSSEAKTSGSSFTFGVSTESTSTTPSFVFGKGLVDSSKTSILSTPPSLGFGQPTVSKSSVPTSSSSSLLESLTSPASLSGNTNLALFGNITPQKSEQDSLKSNTPQVFASTVTKSELSSFHAPLSDSNKAISTASSIDTNKVITPIFSPVVSSQSVINSNNPSVPSSPVVAVIEGAPDLSSTPDVIVISTSNQQPSDIQTSTLPNFPNLTISSSQSLFGSGNVSAPSPATVASPTSTTVSSLFGQSNTSESLFTPATTAPFSFSMANTSQPPFFNKTSAEAVATTKSSFFANTSLETTGTTSSLFGKPASETPGFGQNSFNQGSVFGTSLTTTTSSTGTFFTQPTGGSVFGANATSSTETTNSNFGNQSGGSFSFGKSPFSQTQGSFGLAKSVFGQNSTFGQSASPQTNTGFGQSSALSSFGQGSFFSNLGGKASEDSASKSVFGMGASNNQSSVFGNTGASTFGAKIDGNSSFTGGSFNSPGETVAQSGFGAYQQSPQKPGGFGSTATFGGSPSFGSTAAFGSPPSFGSGNALSSVFGSTQQSANFSNFANANSPTFGSLASQAPTFGSPQQPPQQQQQQQQSGFGQGFGSGSVFGGGSTFGGQTQSFGSPSGGQSNSSAFTQWRN